MIDMTGIKVIIMERGQLVTIGRSKNADMIVLAIQNGDNELDVELELNEVKRALDLF